jgi:NAD(P)-dependent dehydrogenase (short-subunit alcohol dehydrogenase family)
VQWTVDQIPDQSGRVAVVTGANGGIGLCTASALAGAGAHVVMACRNLEKAGAAVTSIRAKHPAASVEVVACDLSSQAATRAAAEQVRADHRRIDLVIANAGVMAMPHRVTEDGWELQLATNHLGHFTFVGLLLDRLLDVPGSRVVSVTSNAHKFGRIRFEDLHSQRKYRRWRAYGQSKLANMLFASELARRLLAARAPTIAGAAHPGYAATEIQATATRASGRRLTARVTGLADRAFGQSPAMGALPSLYAATSPHMISGMLIGPSGLFELWGHPQAVVPGKRAQDVDVARRLWQVSEELTGVTFPV